MSSIFTKIIQGEIPCYKVAESDKFIAFLDVQPIAKGHTLVVPKKEVDYFFDIEDTLLGEYNVFAKEVTRKVKSVVPCIKIGVAVIGLEVPHAHMHLVPMNTLGDLNFSKERLKFTPEQYQELAEAIANA